MDFNSKAKAIDRVPFPLLIYSPFILQFPLKKSTYYF